MALRQLALCICSTIMIVLLQLKLGEAQCLIEGYTEGFGTISCYKVSSGSVSWLQANASCTADGGGAHLVVITNEDENAFVLTLEIGTNKWVGLNKRKGLEWKWEGVPDIVGPPTYYNWQDKAGQSEIDPDGKDPNVEGATDVECVSLQDKTGQWSDRSCSNDAGYGFVCQAPGPPTSQPTGAPSLQPHSVPSSIPSIQPSSAPSLQPFSPPTGVPSSQPASLPTSQPISFPSSVPSLQPFAVPSSTPTSQPSSKPTSVPTIVPTSIPTAQPSAVPTSRPTVTPTPAPTSKPSSKPSSAPTAIPSSIPTQISRSPSFIPTSQPSSLTSMKVMSSMLVLNSDITTFEGAEAYSLAIAAMVAIPFNILPWSVAVRSSSQVVAISRRRLLGYTLSVTTEALLQFHEFPSEYKSDPSAMPDYLNQELFNFIDSGDGTTAFRNELRDNGIDYEDDIIIINSNANPQDYITTASSASDDVTVALIVSFLLLFVCLITFCSWYYYFYIWKPAQYKADPELGQTLNEDEGRIELGQNSALKVDEGETKEMEEMKDTKEMSTFEAFSSTESFSHTDIFKFTEDEPKTAFQVASASNYEFDG